MSWRPQIDVRPSLWGPFNKILWNFFSIKFLNIWIFKVTCSILIIFNNLSCFTKRLEKNINFFFLDLNKTFHSLTFQNTCFQGNNSLRGWILIQRATYYKSTRLVNLLDLNWIGLTIVSSILRLFFSIWLDHVTSTKWGQFGMSQLQLLLLLFLLLWCCFSAAVWLLLWNCGCFCCCCGAAV